MILQGDCLEQLKTMADSSVDAIVTDPPYGLSFMGKKWDYDVPSIDVWKECLRVLKPGGHMLVACGTRTQHRMVAPIEDAGFEIRDVITWLYGSGFPKSLDVSKAIDKAAGAEGPIIGKNPAFCARQLEHDTDWDTAMRPEHKRGPATEAAKQWAGWGTALKPACEFWTLCRKPLEGTVAANVLKWGVGGLNIDGCRVEASAQENAELNRPNKRPGEGASGFMTSTKREFTPSQGRFPANLVLSHSEHCTDDQCDIECAIQQLDAQSGISKSTGGGLKNGDKFSGGYAPPGQINIGKGDFGGASRFFLRVGYDSSELCGLAKIEAEGTFAGKKMESRSGSLSTDGCGSKLTDRFLMGTISITEMGTHSIMSFPILSASTRTCIGTITIESGKTIGSSLAESVVGVSVVSATEASLHFQDGQQEPITGIVSLASESMELAGVIETVSTGTRTIGHIAPSRFLYCAKVSASERNAGLEGMPKKTNDWQRASSGLSQGKNPITGERSGNTLQPKANHHPTVKPLKLMRYLCKLITPPNGLVLDPFAGSGSTGVAALQEGFRFIGIEREAEYVAIAQRRIESCTMTKTS